MSNARQSSPPTSASRTVNSDCTGAPAACCVSAGDIHRRTGAHAAWRNLSALAGRGGTRDGASGQCACVHRRTGAAWPEAAPPRRCRHLAPSRQGQLALLGGDAAKRAASFRARAAARARQRPCRLGNRCADVVGQARLALGNPRAALTATRRATALHRAHDLAALDGMSPALTWWRHSQALQANKQGAGRARSARDGLSVPAAGHRRTERRGTAAQLSEQDRGAPRDRRGMARRTRASAACRRSGAAPISPAKRTCASRSSGWWIRGCA